MDLSRTRVVLRERAVIDVLDLGVRFVMQHGRVYTKTATIVLPLFFLSSIALARGFGWVAAWSFSVFTATFAGAPFTVLASRLVFDEQVRVSGVIKEALRGAGRLSLLRVMTFVGGGIGLVVFTFPGVWFLALTFFVVEVALLERAPARSAVLRSIAIVKRETGPAILALLLLTILHVVTTVSVDVGGRVVISALLESHAPAPLWADGGSVLGLLGFWLFVPYATTARFLVYLDVRTRSEGWDIQTLFVALAARAARTTPRGAAEVRSAA